MNHRGPVGHDCPAAVAAVRPGYPNVRIPASQRQCHGVGAPKHGGSSETITQPVSQLCC